MAAPSGGEQLNETTPPAPAEIRRLAPEVADAIAAGEVIERPASVVKELLENSLDAGAARVTIEIEGGGSQLIRVVDDGLGMSAVQLAIAFERHATSKLRAIDDLARIGTFGFRGEALASIAAVARVAAVSRELEVQAGARVEVVDHEVGVAALVAAAPGTSVEVRDLFHNMPARRAFLRSPRSEATACLRVISEAALGRPDVRFEARLAGRRALGTPGSGDLVEAARAVLGRGVADQLIAVNRTDDEITVVGVLGPPGAAHPNRNALVVMVNGRRVHQRALVAAVEGAYRGVLEAGRHPLAVLDVRCDPGEVDVNVHPTKREVRFRDEGRFFDAVHRACWGALSELSPAILALPTGTAHAEQRPTAWSFGGGARGSAPIEEPQLLGELLPTQHNAGSLAEADRWRYLGQAHNRYLVVATDTGIALLDQHAAHEKVLYARVLEGLAADGDGEPQPSQGLLSPMLLDVGPGVVAGLAEDGDLLRRAGFDLEVFGEATLRCSAVPIGTRLSELAELLTEALGETLDGPHGSAQRLHRVAASVACHSAVRFGDPVSPEQVSVLLRDLAATPGGVTCPHGRPAVLVLSEGQLLSAFRRS